MNIHVSPDDLRKAVVDSLSSPSEDIARHVLALAGANPNQIEKSITTGTGLVAYDLQAPAKNLCASFACANVAQTRLSEVYLQPRPGAPFAATVFATFGAIAHPAALVAGAPAAISFPGLPIDGHVSQGPPPGGDFVPAGLAGPAYVSPGYAPAP